MTIEEVEELRKQEKSGQLRFPRLEVDDFQLRDMLLIGWYMYNIVNDKSALNRMLNKINLKKRGVEISGKGTMNCPYIIKTQVGDGVFYDINQVFKDKDDSFEVGQCFYNSLLMSAGFVGVKDVEQSYCVSGISLMVKNGEKHGILHSVVELNNDMVADVNLGIVMSKSLYNKVFMFEELTRIDGEKVLDLLQVLENKDSLAVAESFNLRSYHMAFALEDLTDFVANEERQKGHDVFADLEY